MRPLSKNRRIRKKQIKKLVEKSLVETKEILKKSLPMTTFSYSANVFDLMMKQTSTILNLYASHMFGTKGFKEK